MTIVREKKREPRGHARTREEPHTRCATGASALRRGWSEGAANALPEKAQKRKLAIPPAKVQPRHLPHASCRDEEINSDCMHAGAEGGRGTLYPEVPRGRLASVHGA